jgi:hypothetical protein
MSETVPPPSPWQQYAADAMAWSTSMVQAVLPECPVLRGVATGVLRTHAIVLRGALMVVEALLVKLQPPEVPRSEKIIIE